MQLSERTKDGLRTAGLYFVVFFLLLFGYRFFQATLINHEPFEFDLAQNLGVPAFTALVGYVTKVFSRQ